MRRLRILRQRRPALDRRMPAPRDQAIVVLQDRLGNEARRQPGKAAERDIDLAAPERRNREIEQQARLTNEAPGASRRKLCVSFGPRIDIAYSGAAR